MFSRVKSNFFLKKAIAREQPAFFVLLEKCLHVFFSAHDKMNQLVRDALSGVPQSQDDKRRMLEWVFTLIGDGPPEKEGDTSSTTDSLSETETRSGLMSHNNRDRSTASSGGPEETGSSASSGGPEETGLSASSGRPEETGSSASSGGPKETRSTASSGGPDDEQEPGDETSVDNSHSNTENANEVYILRIQIIE